MLGIPRVVIPLVCVCAAAEAVSFTKVVQLLNDLQTAQLHRQEGTVQFQFTENEVNEYMRYALQRTPRPGLQSIKVKFFPANYVSTFTVVDFDAVEKWKPGTIPFLLKPVLTGKKAVWMDYRFRAENGAATFGVEKAYFGSVRLPAVFVEKLIQVVAARQPERFDTTKPVPLPMGLRQIWTGRQTVGGRN